MNINIVGYEKASNWLYTQTELFTVVFNPYSNKYEVSPYKHVITKIGLSIISTPEVKKSVVLEIKLKPQIQNMSHILTYAAVVNTIGIEDLFENKTNAEERAKSLNIKQLLKNLHTLNENNQCSHTCPSASNLHKLVVIVREVLKGEKSFSDLKAYMSIFHSEQ